MDATKSIADLAARAEGLRLLVLYGSRARGDRRPDSDWDFAFLGTARFDEEGLRAELVLLLGTDRVDLVDLSRAGGLLRHRVAREGRVLHEAEPGVFEAFWIEAVSFWCDAAPIVSEGYEAVLAELGR